MEQEQLFTLLLVALVTAALGLWMQRTPRPSRYLISWPQRAPFLGGGQPETHAWNRFHVRYYPMTLLLIAFEMEMMFMYPWAVVYVAEGMKAVMEMGMFLGILSVGILYGWREGAFKWQ
ncbi:MAG: NADH-quinone oxidoreductase subunit A [Candidatus Wenzhouxiangella sp. M2_3B_020]